MNNHKQLNISHHLKKWYTINKRSLPWRDTNNPYKIWISEIILQQTRVTQGLEYYLRFIKRFPTVNILAQASETDVLKEWQGLGYYSRARNLHATAKKIVSFYDSKIPDNYNDIISLKGIGDYTAAAILSIAYNKPYAVVDGNVYRVLSRLFAIDTPVDSSLGKKEFKEIAYNLLDEINPGTHNQALMEFGALHCTPFQPLCKSCPLQDICISKELNKQFDFPVKQKKSKVRSRYFNYFNVNYNGYSFFNKRIGKDIWKNMYEFPLIETDEEVDLTQLFEADSFKTLFANANVAFILKQTQVKHILTHQHIYTNFYEVEATKLNEYFVSNFLKIEIDEIHTLPMPRLIHRYLEYK
ncbi:MAG: A/G-specific adenine glycosylase [Dysgonamonadaceae bacterium]|nr:A/G-specific adenine glycosylase [Dysgonamonadaceae bacterium]MDD4727391.1 A/G-specific adenine glycosylase [Dysgonamonadaceae bacterium]